MGEVILLHDLECKECVVLTWIIEFMCDRVISIF